MKLKYFTLFAVTFISLQLIDFIIFSFALGEINSGFIFGIFSGNFLAESLAIILLILLYWMTPSTKTAILAFCLLVASVASNIFDRFAYGGVVDYIKIWFVPTFNIADILIVISVITIFTQLIKKSHQE